MLYALPLLILLASLAKADYWWFYPADSPTSPHLDCHFTPGSMCLKMTNNMYASHLTILPGIQSSRFFRACTAVSGGTSRYQGPTGTGKSQ